MLLYPFSVTSSGNLEIATTPANQARSRVLAYWDTVRTERFTKPEYGHNIRPLLRDDILSVEIERSRLQLQEFAPSADHFLEYQNLENGRARIRHKWTVRVTGEEFEVLIDA